MFGAMLSLFKWKDLRYGPREARRPVGLGIFDSCNALVNKGERSMKGSYRIYLFFVRISFFTKDIWCIEIVKIFIDNDLCTE